jgi:hypothetical protein
MKARRIRSSLPNPAPRNLLTSSEAGSFRCVFGVTGYRTDQLFF